MWGKGRLALAAPFFWPLHIPARAERKPVTLLYFESLPRQEVRRPLWQGLLNLSGAFLRPCPPLESQADLLRRIAEALDRLARLCAR